MTETNNEFNPATLAEDLYPSPAPVIKHAYHNSLGSCKFIFKDGTEAAFTGGHYYTDDQSKIDELNEEIRRGHPYIYVKPEQQTVNVALADPMDEVRRAAAADAIARFAAIQKSNDMGNTTQSDKLEGIGNSDTVAALSGDSTSVDAAPAAGVANSGTVATATTGVPSSSLAALKANLANKS